MTLNPDNTPEKVIWASSPELQHNDLPCVGMQVTLIIDPCRYKVVG